MMDVAVYKGDNLICLGTVDECAKVMGIRLETVKFYLTPSYQKILKKRKEASDSLVVIKIEEDEK